MSDTRSEKVSAERHLEVAQRLGMKPGEVTVYDGPDGEYARFRDGHRLLLLDGGAVAWYGEKAPNPTYPNIVPSVDLDESEPVDVEEEEPDVEEEEPVNDPPAAPDGGTAKVVELEGPPPRHGAGSGREPWAAYATKHQVDVPEGVGRDQIIQLLDDAQVPTA